MCNVGTHLTISKDHYEDLFNRGLLDPRYPALDAFKQGRKERDSAQKVKKVDVYAIQILIRRNGKLQTFERSANLVPSCILENKNCVFK